MGTKPVISPKDDRTCIWTVRRSSSWCLSSSGSDRPTRARLSGTTASHVPGNRVGTRPRDDQPGGGGLAGCSGGRRRAVPGPPAATQMRGRGHLKWPGRQKAACQTLHSASPRAPDATLRPPVYTAAEKLGRTGAFPRQRESALAHLKDNDLGGVQPSCTNRVPPSVSPGSHGLCCLLAFFRSDTQSTSRLRKGRQFS